MIEKLVERDPANRDEALTLVKEHTDLAKKSKAFHDMLIRRRPPGSLELPSDHPNVLHLDGINRAELSQISFQRSSRARRRELISLI